MEYIVIDTNSDLDPTTYPLETDEQIAEARCALADAGLAYEDVWTSPTDEHAPEAYKSGRKLFAEVRVWTISTDSGSVKISAATADEAAAEYARREEMRGVEDADDLRAYIERKGGYGFLEGSDGERVWTVAQ